VLSPSLVPQFSPRDRLLQRGREAHQVFNRDVHVRRKRLRKIRLYLHQLSGDPQRSAVAQHNASDAAGPALACRAEQCRGYGRVTYPERPGASATQHREEH
jgi:hypothetical protein